MLFHNNTCNKRLVTFNKRQNTIVYNFQSSVQTFTNIFVQYSDHCDNFFIYALLGINNYSYNKVLDSQMLYLYIFSLSYKTPINVISQIVELIFVYMLNKSNFIIEF